MLWTITCWRQPITPLFTSCMICPFMLSNNNSTSLSMTPSANFNCHSLHIRLELPQQCWLEKISHMPAFPHITQVSTAAPGECIVPRNTQNKYKQPQILQTLSQPPQTNMASPRQLHSPSPVDPKAYLYLSIFYLLLATAAIYTFAGAIHIHIPSSPVPQRPECRFIQQSIFLSLARTYYY